MAQRSWFCRLFALALCVASVPAVRAASSFRIDQLYSNLDGSVQYIQLRESAGRDGEQAIGGLKLRVTGNGFTREYVLPSDLRYSTTAGRTVLVSTQAGVPVCCSEQQVFFDEFTWQFRWSPSGLTADFGGLPERFLPVDGGTLELVGVDAVSYGELPTSGYKALDRNGQVVTAVVMPFWIAAFPYAIQLGVPLPGRVMSTQVSAREYYHAGLDHYLLTARAEDIEAIESGRAPGWIETDYSLSVPTLSGPFVVSSDGPIVVNFDTVPVCRYYLAPPYGDTHFLSASPAECAAVGRDQPGAVLESSATFYVYAADPASGACAAYRQPVYRLWNGKSAANHRYTWSEDVRAGMIAKGWIPEGYGPLGVAFCIEWFGWDF